MKQTTQKENHLVRFNVFIIELHNKREALQG